MAAVETVLELEEPRREWGLAKGREITLHWLKFVAVCLHGWHSQGPLQTGMILGPHLATRGEWGAQS